MDVRKFKISGYKMALLFNMFPSYSISVWVTSIFVQPRLFSLPFLMSKTFSFRLNRWNLFLLANILITVITPVMGMFFNRQFSFLDIAYVLSSVYTFLFVNSIVSSDRHIRIFNEFLRITLLINAYYVLFQLFCYYTGLTQWEMIHSNVPHHVLSGYTIEPGFLPGIPRYTGLFIESGPLAFFLCLTFPYLLQRGVSFSRSMKIAAFLLIFFSQSKFIFAFLPVLLLEWVARRMFPKIYSFATRPGTFFLGVVALVFLIIAVIFGDFGFHEYLGKEVPAYKLRLAGLRNALGAILDIEPFGKGLLGTNYDVKGAKFELLGSDVFSIIFLGYGLVMGILMLLCFLVVPILANIDYKFTFCVVVIFGFLSSGSLIVPQYLFVLVYAIVAHYLNSSKDRNPEKRPN